MVRVRRSGQGVAVTLAHRLGGEALERGESVAVDGCCLTVLEPTAAEFDADLTPETLLRTGGVDTWKPGRNVNLERALAIGDRLGGHIVQGHVDERLEVLGIVRTGDGSATLRVALEGGQGRYLVEKGSVALAGVSLTVSRLESAWFEIALIPATLSATTLGDVAGGDRLNVEYDVLAKHVERLIARE